jgi:cation transport regulator ChaC
VSELLVFAYGSLIGQPELPDALRSAVPATLPGWRRSFNKRSANRGTPVAEAFAVETAAGFERDGHRHSLALGTEVGGAMAGAVLRYPGAVRDELLATLDRREGFFPRRPPAASGYVRRRVEVRVDGAPVEAITYLSNPDPSGAFRVPSDWDAAARARVLVAASPRSPRASDWRGLHYLEGVRGSLLAAGVVDPELEALAQAIRAVDGPWVERVAPPR